MATSTTPAQPGATPAQPGAAPADATPAQPGTAPASAGGRGAAGAAGATSDAGDAGAAAPVTRTRRPAPVGALVLIALLIGLVLTAFALPALHSAPHHVPIGVAGPALAAGQVSAALEANESGAFAVTTFPDETALTKAIRDRDVYGGIVVGAQGPRVLTAPAGSPAVAQVLTALATGLSQQTGQQVPVSVVVPLPTGDARGAGLASALLPLIIGSVAPVLAMIRLVRRPWARLAGVLTSAVLVGSTLAALLHWYGAFTGSWALDAAAIAAILAAMSTALLGLYTVGRWVGFGLGVATFVLIGNPLSGIATAPEFLPNPWATLGSWLPPGAGGQVLRSTAYFDGAGATHGLVVLASWFGLGLLLVALGSRRPQPEAA